MSPSSNQVTGHDDEQQQLAQIIAQVTQEEVAKQFAARGEAPPPNPGAAQPIPVTLNGQTYNFNSADDLSKSVQTLVDAYNQQLAEAKKPAAPVTREVTGQDDETWDTEKFVTKMTTNPLDALNYADQIRYGVKDPAKAIKEAIAAKTELDQVRQVLDVYRFRDLHPEISGNPQATQHIARIMQERGLPQNVQGLETAYAHAVMAGAIPHPLQAAQNQQFQQNQPQPQQWGQQNQPQQNLGWGGTYQGTTDPRFAPAGFNGGRSFAPPTVGRGASGPGPDIMAEAENLTADQLARVIARFQS